MSSVSRTMATLALLLCGIHLEQRLIAQQAPPPSQLPTPRWLDKQWGSAHNQWQRTPVDISEQTDTVSADVRARRNAYWMQYPQQIALRDGPPLPGVRVLRPEVGEVKGAQSIWVVARFEGLHVFALDPDSTEFYTEMNMRVISVIKSPDDFPVSAGSLLDVLILGGSAKTAQGTVHEFRVEPHQFSAQPGHTYLLHLLYDPLYGIMSTCQRWDVSSGTLLPDDEDEFHRIQKGKSVLAGKSVEEATKYILSVLKTQSAE